MYSVSLGCIGRRAQAFALWQRCQITMGSAHKYRAVCHRFPLYVASNLFVKFHQEDLSSVICHLSSLSSLRSLSSLSRIRASIAMLAFRIDRTLNAGFAQVQTTNQA